MDSAEPLSLFAEIKSACETPTTTVMKDAIAARLRLSTKQANTIAYLAGFTHFPETESLLEQAGLTWKDNSCVLLDSRTKTLHSKIVLHDLTHEHYASIQRIVANTYQTYRFKNMVRPQRPDGTYVMFIDPLPGMTPVQWWAELSKQTPSLTELITTVGIPITDGWALRIHIARIPTRNTYENLKRHFLHAAVVIAINDADPDFNLSIEHLRNQKDDFEYLRKPTWHVLANQHAGPLAEFLADIQAANITLIDLDNTTSYVQEVVTNMLAMATSLLP